MATIPHGAEWESEIHRALGQSSFLIPILTPAFLQSRWCCLEVTRFRRREIELGHADLIFPFHYIDIQDVDPDRPQECQDPKVLSLLNARQQIDFRDLLYHAPDSGEVRTRVGKLAASVHAALRRGATVPPLVMVNATEAPPPAAGPRE